MTIHEAWPGSSLPTIGAVQPGDAIHFHGGVYDGGITLPYRGTRSAPITITNAPGEYVEVTRPSTPQGEKTQLLVWLARGSEWLILEENPAGGELLLRHDPPTRTEDDLALGFRISGNHCEVRNVRTTGAIQNSRDRCTDGAVSGIVVPRWGVDSSVSKRGSGYALYAQNPQGSRLTITDMLCGVGYSTALHIFGSNNAVRDVMVERCFATCSGALSQFEVAKAPVVVDEEDHIGLCDGLVIRDCVIGQPFQYRGGGGFGHGSIQLGGFRSPPNGAVTLMNCDLIGAPHTTEPWAWVRASGNWVAHRPGQSNVSEGWIGRQNILNGALEQPEIFLHPGLGEPFPPTMPPRLRVWANPTEPGRAHVSVLAFRGERSVPVDLYGIVQRGRRYSVTEIMRGVTTHFTAGESTIVDLELPDMSPPGVRPERDPHPILWAFLIRKA